MQNNSLNSIIKNKKRIIQIVSILELIFFIYLLSISFIVFQNNLYLAHLFISFGLIFNVLIFIVSFRSNEKTEYFFSIALSFMAWLLLFIILIITGGIYSAYFLGYLLIIFISYVLLYSQSILINGILAILSAIILLVLQNNSIINSPENNYIFSSINSSNSYQIFALNIVIILFFIILLKLFDSFITKNILNQQQTIDIYQNNNNNLTENLLITNQKLERTTKQLINSEKYSQVIDKLLSPISIEKQWMKNIEEHLQILEKITDSIHCGIYLLDDNKEWVSLSISSNEFGKNLIKNEHRYHISSDNLIITSTQYKIIQRKRNIGIDSVAFQENPFIESNYVIAFPIHYKGIVYGVLEFQNKLETNISDFDEKYLSQIASIFAIIFMSNQEESFNKPKDNNQYQKTQNSTVWLPNELSESKQVYRYERGESKILDHSNRNFKNNYDSISIPVKISNQTIATLRCSKNRNNESFDKDEIESLNKIASQLAIAITNSKIKNEIDILRKQSDITTEITSELRKSVDIETLLKNAVKTIGYSLNADDVSIRLLSETDNQVENEE